MLPEMFDIPWTFSKFRVSVMILLLDKYKKQQKKITDVHRDGRIKKRTQTRVSRIITDKMHPITYFQATGF